jgi:laccase
MIIAAVKKLITNLFFFLYIGVWFMHCHFEFHLSMGMIALFIVEDGPTANTSLPSPPADFLTYGIDNNLMRDE